MNLQEFNERELNKIKYAGILQKPQYLKEEYIQDAKIKTIRLNRTGVGFDGEPKTRLDWKQDDGTGYVSYHFEDATEDPYEINEGINELRKAVFERVDNLIAKRKAAIATLEHLGYEYNGGERWKPVVGKADFESFMQEELIKAKERRSATYSRLKNEIIKEYLEAQQSEYK